MLHLRVGQLQMCIRDSNMASLNRVAEFLYREETITGEQFMSLLRGLPEPGATSTDEGAQA